jgi:hypothetical protein
MTSPAWIPDTCTLPTTERPRRLAAFDHLLTTALRGRQRLSPTTLRWDLDPAAETAARDLTRRENTCCPFFTFTFHRADDLLQLHIEVPPDHSEILDALTRPARR